MSVAAHLCPPTAIGWTAKAAHPSKPCRTTSALAGRAYTSAGQAASALHSMAVLQVFQAKLLQCMDKAGPDPAAFRELRSATDLALRATKTTAQAIGRSMASLVVLERHLWLMLTEIKDADKVPFLDSPVSPTGLFRPAVEGFTERCSRHSSRPRQCDTSCQSTPALQMARVAPDPCRLPSLPRQRHRLPSQYPGLRLETDLVRLDATRLLSAKDPGPRLCWTQRPRRLPDLRDRKREGPSPAVAGPTPKLPRLNLQAPRSVPGAKGNVFFAVTVQAPKQPTAAIADIIKHKHSQ